VICFIMYLMPSSALFPSTGSTTLWVCVWNATFDDPMIHCCYSLRFVDSMQLFILVIDTGIDVGGYSPVFDTCTFVFYFYGRLML
jgi:hypothetical protein